MGVQFNIISAVLLSQYQLIFLQSSVALSYQRRISEKHEFDWERIEFKRKNIVNQLKTPLLKYFFCQFHVCAPPAVSSPGVRSCGIFSSRQGDAGLLCLRQRNAAVHLERPEY